MKKVTPYVTEKSVELTKQGKFTIIVDFTSTKKEIESLVRKFYRVKPLSVRVIKTKYLSAVKSRKYFLDRGVKKAIIELEKGQKIPGFEFENKDEKDKNKKTQQVKQDKTKINKKDGQES